MSNKVEKLNMIEEKANKVLDIMIDGLEKAGNAVQAELPSLLNEYITYFIIDEFPLRSLVLLIIVPIIGYVLFKRCSKVETNNVCEEDNKEFTLWMIAVLATIICGVSLFNCMGDFKNVYKLTHAPKAYLIEKFRK